MEKLYNLYNSQAFPPEEVKLGLHLDLLQVLLDYNNKSKDHYNDIHITTDGYCLIVEWICAPLDRSYGGSFEYIAEDQLIMIEKLFPDDHYEYCFNEDDYEERLDAWLKKNPGWVKTSHGTWTNEIENEKFREELEKTSKLDESSESSTSESSQYLENGIPQGH